MVPIQGVLKDTSHNLSALVEYGCSDALYDDRFSLAVWSELRTIFWSALELLASCCMVVMYMVVSVVKVVVVNVPFVLVVLGRVVHFHRTQLTRGDIAVEVALLSTIMLVVQYRSRMVAAWCRFERALEKRSRTAARVAPTVTFFSLTAAFSVLGRNFLDPLVAPSVLPLFTLVVPVLMGGHFLHGLASLQREDSLPAGGAPADRGTDDCATHAVAYSRVLSWNRHVLCRSTSYRAAQCISRLGAPLCTGLAGMYSCIAWPGDAALRHGGAASSRAVLSDACARAHLADGQGTRRTQLQDRR